MLSPHKELMTPAAHLELGHSLWGGRLVRGTLSGPTAGALPYPGPNYCVRIP